MPTSKASPRSHAGMGIAAACVGLCLVVVGVAFLRQGNTRPLKAAPTPVDTADDRAENAAELAALRAEVRRLALLVEARALATPPTPVEPAEEPALAPDSAPDLAPELPRVTRDDAVALYEASRPNSGKTRAVASALDELLRRESLASSHVEVDEVACRGESCRVSVSFAEDASPQTVVMELASLLPDSHSFQEPAPAGANRRAVTSIYVDDAKTP